MPLPIKYHWRNLFVRKTTTILTVLLISAVLGTFTWLLGFIFALNGSLSVASDGSKIIVLQRGALSETNSSISTEEFNRLNQLGEIEEVDGVRLASPEMFVQVSLPRIRDGGKTYSNVAVRGVTEVALNVHRNVRLLDRMFSTSEPEVIVGRGAARQFGGLELGSKIKLGFAANREYTVAGYFTADGGPMESEIWGYLPSLQSAYGRSGYSAASLRLRAGAKAEEVVKQIEGAAIQLGAQTETDYWSKQSENVRNYQLVCKILVATMGIAAMFAITNTMYAFVAGRTREIAMLRTIGYTGGQVLRGFIVESIMLSLLGGVVGCVGCQVYLAIAGNTKDMFGSNTFTAMAFEIRVGPMLIAISLASVAVLGVIGAFFPARRAARINVLGALREP